MALDIFLSSARNDGSVLVLPLKAKSKDSRLSNA